MTQSKSGPKNQTDISPKKTYRWLINTWKDAQHHSLSEKCKSKSQWGTISHPVRMAAIKKSTNNKYWRACGEKGTLLHCSWGCKLIQPLWRTVWRTLWRTVKKLEIELPEKSEKWKWKSLSYVWFFVTPWTIQSMEFSRPEYWSG